jgi:hypothetical protein
MENAGLACGALALRPRPPASADAGISAGSPIRTTRPTGRNGRNFLSGLVACGQPLVAFIRNHTERTLPAVGIRLWHTVPDRSAKEQQGPFPRKYGACQGMEEPNKSLRPSPATSKPRSELAPARTNIKRSAESGRVPGRCRPRGCAGHCGEGCAGHRG